MPIPSKYFGTYTSTVTNWAGPHVNPSGTLVVPSPNNSNQIRYTIANGNDVDVTPTWSSSNPDLITFSVANGSVTYTFTANAWATNPSNKWTGSCSDGQTNMKDTVGGWGANKNTTREEVTVKKEVA